MAQLPPPLVGNERSSSHVSAKVTNSPRW